MTASGTAVPTVLDGALEEVLAAVSLTAEGTGVYLGDREVRADQPRQLRQRLGTALYETFHAGHAFGDKPGILHRDMVLESKLAEVVPHTTTPVAAQPVPAQPLDDRPVDDQPVDDQPAAGDPVVLLGGVRVRLPTGALPAGPGSRQRAQVALDLPTSRPRLSPGFFLVDGSRGSCGPGPLLRLYLHLVEPAPAVEVWKVVLECLEEQGVPYRTKITSSRRLLPRRDGLVVYLGPESWHAVPAVVQAVPTTAVGASISAFAHVLAPGVALAWEPDDGRPGRKNSSFGQHRSLAIAEGIMDSVEDGDLSRLHTHVFTRLNESGIDPSALFRNSGSPVLSFPY